VYKNFKKWILAVYIDAVQTGQALQIVVSRRHVQYFGKHLPGGPFAAETLDQPLEIVGRRFANGKNCC